MLADTGLFDGTYYGIPEGWWVVIGLAAGLVVALLIFVIVFLSYTLPHLRKQRLADEKAAWQKCVTVYINPLQDTDDAMVTQCAEVADESVKADRGADTGHAGTDDSEKIANAHESAKGPVKGEGPEIGEEVVSVNMEDVMENETEEIISENASDETAAEAVADAEANTCEAGDEICDADDIGDDERYDKSFLARLILADDELKSWYSTLKNAALSYKGARSSIAWKQEKLRCGRKQIGKLLIRGKVLCLYLNLTMDDLKDCPVHYRVEDVSARAINAATPIMYRIKNPLRVRHAVDLIDMVAAKEGLVKSKKFVPVDYAAQLAPKTVAQLMEEGLIKTAPATEYETFTPDKSAK